MSNVCHGGRTIEMIETAASHTRTERDRKKIMQGIPKETLRRMYVDMVRTRTLDEKIKEMLNRGFSISEFWVGRESRRRTCRLRRASG